MTSNFMDLLNSLDLQKTTSGSLVRAIRTNFGFTLKDIESITGIQESNLSAIENDRMELTKKKAEEIGIALGIHPGSLLFPNGYFEKTQHLIEIEEKAAQVMQEKKLNFG
jgi:transcriptional regulator with XRE-family HTH domain